MTDNNDNNEYTQPELDLNAADNAAGTPSRSEQPTEVISNANLDGTSDNPQAGQPAYGAYSPTPAGQPPLPPVNTPSSPWNDNNANNADKKAAKPVTTGTVIVSSIITGVASILLTAGLLSSGVITSHSSGNIADIDSSQTGSAGSSRNIAGDSVDWSSVNKKVSSSVVSIQTQLNNGVAAGSGAVIDAENGYIITNNHVVESAKTIYVTLSNGQIYEADLKGSDATTDIAVIKLKKVPKGLTAVSFGDSDKLAVGESTMAVGNPLGYANSASTGIISALNRPVSVVDGNAGNGDKSSPSIVTNAIQVDAAVNQGNSGGPLFNADGEVIGITSSIASLSSSSSSAGSIGIGFAIPSNLVKKVSNAIIKDGSFTHAQLGVSVKTGTVTAEDVTRGGAEVKSVTTGGAAAKAGLKENDVIVAYNGHSVDSVEALLGFVRAASVGEKPSLTVVRNNTVITVDVTLEKATEATLNNNTPQQDDGNDNNGLRDDTEDGDDMFDYLFGDMNR